jgi:hypothetical protein
VEAGACSGCGVQNIEERSGVEDLQSRGGSFSSAELETYWQHASFQVSTVHDQASDVAASHQGNEVRRHKGYRGDLRYLSGLQRMLDVHTCRLSNRTRAIMFLILRGKRGPSVMTILRCLGSSISAR